jgi:hypothetical protein
MTTSVNNTSGQFIAGVKDAGSARLYANIFSIFQKQFKNNLNKANETIEARGR